MSFCTWLLWGLCFTWQVCYIGVVLGYFEGWASADRYVMLGLYLVLRRAEYQLTGLLCQFCAWLLWGLSISWQVCYVRFVLGCSEGWVSADGFVMSVLCLVALRAEHQVTGMLCKVCTWLFWGLCISWQVCYVSFVLGCFEGWASGDKLCKVCTWLFWGLSISWQVCYVSFVLGCFEGWASADRYVM